MFNTKSINEKTFFNKLEKKSSFGNFKNNFAKREWKSEKDELPVHGHLFPENLDMFIGS